MFEKVDTLNYAARNSDMELLKSASFWQMKTAELQFTMLLIGEILTHWYLSQHEGKVKNFIIFSFDELIHFFVEVNRKNVTLRDTVLCISQPKVETSTV